MKKMSFVVVILGLFFAAGVCSAFQVSDDGEGNQLHWNIAPGQKIPYYICEPVTQSCTGASVALAVQAVTSSFAVWESVPSSYVAFDYRGTTTTNPVGAGQSDGINLIRWVSKSTWEITRPPNSVAIAYMFFSSGDGHIFECDIDINDSYAWSVSGAAQKFDIQNIVTNQVGQFIGLTTLTGAANTEKTMFGSYTTSETKKRTLEEDDEAGANHLYPTILKPDLDPLPYFSTTGNYTVSWKNGSNTDYYQVQQGETEGFAVTESNTTASNSRVYAAMPEGNYFYHVRSHGDTEGYSEWSASDSIVVDWTPPVGSVLINNGDTFAKSDLALLDFSVTETLSGTNTVVLSNLPDFSSAGTFTYSDTAVWSIDIASDGLKTVYARFIDAAGNVSADNTDAIIYDSTAPSTVTVISLPDWSDTSVITLDWNDSIDSTSGVLFYTVSRSPAKAGVYAVIAVADTSTFTDTDTRDGEAWFYKVMVTDYAENTSVSAVESIAIDVQAPNTPGLVYPPDTGKINNAVPVFSWSLVDTGSPLVYFIEVSDANTFSSIVYSNTVTNQSAALTQPLQPCKTYYWRVIAKDVFRLGPVSSVHSFSSDTYPPVVSITGPENGRVTVSGTLVCTGTVFDSGPVNTVALFLNGVLSSVPVNAGVFAETLSLGRGFNAITIAAIDEYGNTSSASVSIEYVSFLGGIISPYSASDTNVTSGIINVSIGSGAFSETVIIAITNNVAYDSVIAADNSAIANPNLIYVAELETTVCEVNAFRVVNGVFSCTDVLTGNLLSTCTLKIGYPAGFAGTSAESALRIFTLDTNTLTWVIVPGPQVVDKALRQVRAGVSHFSVFRVISLAVASTSLSNVIVYPNPYTPAKAVGGTLKFLNLTTKATIKIYTVSGELVRTISKDDVSDKAVWDGKNEYGEYVANGLYFYAITSGKTKDIKTGKFAVRK